MIGDGHWTSFVDFLKHYCPLEICIQNKLVYTFVD